MSDDLDFDYPPIPSGDEWRDASHEECVEKIEWLIGVNRKWQERVEKAESLLQRFWDVDGFVPDDLAAEIREALGISDV